MEAIVLFWLVLAVIVGVAANTRGRSGIGWFVLAAIISPLLAGLLALALPGRKTRREVEDEIATLRACPHCAEAIRREATICRWCHQAVTPEPYQPPLIEPRAAIVGGIIVLALAVAWAISQFGSAYDRAVTKAGSTAPAVAAPEPAPRAEAVPTVRPEATQKPKAPAAKDRPGPPLKLNP